MKSVFSIAVLTIAANAALAMPAFGQIRVDSRMYTTSGSCAQCNLSGRTLTGLTLQDSNFAGAHFNRSNLSGGNFDRSNLSATQFRRAFLARVEGQTVNMAEADFQDATLTEAKFDRVILTNSDLSRADLTRATLTYSDFKDANLTSAIAPDVNFEGSKFANARFDHMNLRNARLNDGHFLNVKFGDAELTGASFSGADLSKADLSNTKGLTQAQLDEACGNSETLLPIGLSVPYCESAEMGAHDKSMPDKMPPHIRKAAKRLDNAIDDIEALISETPSSDRTLRRRLQIIHSDLSSSRRAISK